MANEIKNIDNNIYLKCKQCEDFKLLNKEYWYKHNQWYMWFLWRCKECILKWRKTEHELSMSRKRDFHRYYFNQKRRSFVYENTSKRRKEKWYSNIHSKTSRYIKKNWKRPSICSVCLINKDRIEAHHFDYNQWNKIIFCCSLCHSKLDMWKINYKDYPIIDISKSF